MALYENEITEGDITFFINKDYRNDIGTETQSLQVLEDIRKLVRGTTQENKEIVIALNAIKANVGFVEIESDKGHDSFLLDVPDFLKAVKNFLDKSFVEKS